VPLWRYIAPRRVGNNNRVFFGRPWCVYRPSGDRPANGSRSRNLKARPPPLQPCGVKGAMPPMRSKQYNAAVLPAIKRPVSLGAASRKSPPFVSLGAASRKSPPPRVRQATVPSRAPPSHRRELRPGSIISIRAILIRPWLGGGGPRVAAELQPYISTSSRLRGGGPRPLHQPSLFRISCSCTFVWKLLPTAI
jgi:hypothetical protein